MPKKTKKTAKPKNSNWHLINEYVLIEILLYLDLPDLSRACSACKWWAIIGRSEVLWKKKFRQRFSQVK